MIGGRGDPAGGLGGAGGIPAGNPLAMGLLIVSRTSIDSFSYHRHGIEHRHAFEHGHGARIEPRARPDPAAMG